MYIKFVSIILSLWIIKLNDDSSTLGTNSSFYKGHLLGSRPERSYFS